MNKCPVNNFECVYALSEDSPFPCFATQEECNFWKEKINKEVKKLKGD